MATATLTKQYLTRAETAEFIRVKPNTLAKWAMIGAGPAFVKINARVVRYPLSAVQAFLDNARTVGTVAD